MEYLKYKEAVSYLESLSWRSFSKSAKNGSKKIFLQRVRFFLRFLGNPQDTLKCAHITGTSGKGSVSLMLASILSAAKKKTGVFISPFLTTTIERIGVDGKFISPAEFIRLVDFVKPIIEKCSKESPYGAPSYFETVLAIAFLYFKKKKCSWAVLEAGIGGSFDATNVIKNPQISIITNVGLDHTHILGRTKKEIALDKAGIIKKGAYFISGEKTRRLLKIFEEISKQRKAKYRKISLKYEVLKSDLSGLDFAYNGKIYQTRFVGEHQIGNSLLAISATRLLGVKETSIAAGLREMILPGRLEIMQETPRVIIDGAHNPDKILSTVNFLRKLKYQRLFLVIAVAKKKDLQTMFGSIMPLADKVFLTGFSSRRRSSIGEKRLRQAAAVAGKRRVKFFLEAEKALEASLAQAGKSDLILVTGSCHLAGKLRQKWYSEKFILEKRKMA